MARFITSFTVEIQLEAVTVQEAFQGFVRWRKLVMAAMHGHFQELKIYRVSIKPSHDFTEVNDFWLQDHYLRGDHKEDWEYNINQEPVIQGSKLMLTHRIAVKTKTEDTERS